MSCTPVVVALPTVTRIPIAGQAPYNTLVICTFIGTVPADVHLTRATTRLTSKFKLDKFLQTNPPPDFKHTSCGWLAGTAPMNLNDSASGKDAWMYAIDDIPNAGFDGDGYFWIEVDTVMMVPLIPLDFASAGTGALMASSCVLVVEPQPDESGKVPPRQPMSTVATSVAAPEGRHDPPRHGPTVGTVLTQKVSVVRPGEST